MRKPKKFDLVHQTVSPCERVGSGDKTKHTCTCDTSIYSKKIGVHTVDLMTGKVHARTTNQLNCKYQQFAVNYLMYCKLVNL